jgi:hypothetical protein
MVEGRALKTEVLQVERVLVERMDRIVEGLREEIGGVRGVGGEGGRTQRTAAWKAFPARELRLKKI